VERIPVFPICINPYTFMCVLLAKPIISQTDGEKESHGEVTFLCIVLVHGACMHVQWEMQE
jgi:hypothetical protein